MRKLMYFCDFCKKQPKRRHLSINFDLSGYSGYVEPIDGVWKHIENALRPSSHEHIKQFCSTRCLSKYFLRSKK